MLKYDADPTSELFLIVESHRIEDRDGQWVDIYLTLSAEPYTSIPSDITELGALVVCNAEGHIAEIAVLDEGIDCAYRFSHAENLQIARYVQEHFPGKRRNIGKY